MSAGRALGIAASCAALAACSAESGTVSGQFTTRYVTDSGEIERPADLSGYDVFALVANGDGYDEYPGDTLADGRFEIPDVPAGDYYLGYRGPSQVVARHETKRHPIYTGTVLGRADAPPVASDQTTLTLELDGLRAWQSGDYLQLFSSNAGVLLHPGEGIDSVTPDDGATTLSGQPLQYIYDFQPRTLVDGDAGDRMFAAQLVARVAGGMEYWSIERVGLLDPFVMVDGADTVARGTLEGAPEQSLEVGWDTTAASGMIEQLPEGALLWGGEFVVSVSPDPKSLRCASGIPDLVLASVDGGEAGVAALPYADPYPASWRRIVCLSVLYEYRPPELDIPVLASIGITVPLDDAESGDGVSLVQGPVRNVTIVGQTPVLTWDEPGAGRADAYGIVVYRTYETEGGSSLYEVVASFTTPDTSFAVPPQVLVAGESYFASITARQFGDDLDASASVPTAPFTL
jgi:hypothetical protein